MKSVCAKHDQAFEDANSCPWCEPAKAEGPPAAPAAPPAAAAVLKLAAGFVVNDYMGCTEPGCRARAIYGCKYCGVAGCVAHQGLPHNAKMCRDGNRLP